MHESVSVRNGGTRVSQHPSKNKFKTKQLVAHLKVGVGENHKLEASRGYTVRPGLSEQSFELITITRGRAYSSLVGTHALAYLLPVQKTIPI